MVVFQVFLECLQVSNTYFSVKSTNYSNLTSLVHLLISLAGYIFIDYLANAIALVQGQATRDLPKFYRRLDLSGKFL